MRRALCLCLLACSAQARMVHESADSFRLQAQRAPSAQPNRPETRVLPQRTAAPFCAYVSVGHINAGKAIEIQGVLGDVVAEASPTGEVQVLAVPKSGTGDLTEVQMQVRDHEGGTTVTVDYSRGSAAQVDFKVLVPAGVKFVGRTRLGRVAASLPNNIVEAHTVQGDVELNTTGLTRASTVNGSITATLTGPNPVDLRTVNGDVTVTVPRLDGPLLTLWTTHGDIRVLTR